MEQVKYPSAPFTRVRPHSFVAANYKPSRNDSPLALRNSAGQAIRVNLADE